MISTDATNLPMVLDLPAAATLLGIGRTKAYELVRDDAWPTLIIRLGKLIKGRPGRCSICSKAALASRPELFKFG